MGAELSRYKVLTFGVCSTELLPHDVEAIDNRVFMRIIRLLTVEAKALPNMLNGLCAENSCLLHTAGKWPNLCVNFCDLRKQKDLVRKTLSLVHHRPR